MLNFEGSTFFLWLTVKIFTETILQICCSIRCLRHVTCNKLKYCVQRQVLSNTHRRMLISNAATLHCLRSFL